MLIKLWQCAFLFLLLVIVVRCRKRYSPLAWISLAVAAQTSWTPDIHSMRNDQLPHNSLTLWKKELQAERMTRCASSSPSSQTRVTSEKSATCNVLFQDTFPKKRVTSVKSLTSRSPLTLLLMNGWNSAHFKLKSSFLLKAILDCPDCFRNLTVLLWWYF